MEFIFTFVVYGLIFLIWHNWNLTSKQIVEMIFIGTLLGLVSAFTYKWFNRLIERLVQKVLKKIFP